MPNIQDTWLKIKRFLDVALGEGGLLVIVAVVGLGAFGLGRLSAMENTRAPMTASAAPAALSTQTLPLGGEFVAARSGSAYYFPWCSGARSIKGENQVWFRTAAAAEKAGYAPGKNCRGLEN